MPLIDQQLWCGSTNGEGYQGEYLSREDAIAAFPAEYELEPGERFWIGRQVAFTPAGINLAYHAIDQLRERAYDECGEWAEDYLDDVDEAQEKDLQAMLEPVVQAWLAKHNLQAKFYSVTDVQEHVVPEEIADEPVD